MTDYEDYEKSTLIAMLQGKDKTLSNRNEKIAELHKEITKLKQEHGIQNDDFIDTPSLNIIQFDENGRPICSEHGAMNCYEYKIYRCVMCGVAVSLNGKKVIKSSE
jgi:methionyl-tRNA synthetase